MKYNFTMKMFGTVLDQMMKKDIPDRAVRKQVKQEYRAILERAKDIGAKNRLLFSYALAAFFIAMNRKDGITPEENYQIMDKTVRESKLIKLAMGDSKGYFSEKHIEGCRQWSKETHEKKYSNDWVVDVVEKADNFEFGFDYTECGVCKLCRDENCFELAHYLCRLDFLLVAIMGIRLERTTTLADGGDKCDFRFVKQ